MNVAEFFASLGLIPDEKSFSRGDALISGVKKAVVALGAAIAVSTFKHWIDEVSGAGDQAVKTAQRMGFTVEAVQELDYALGQSDASLSDLKAGLKHMAKDGVKDPEKALASLADKFAAMEDGPAKTKLAVEKLGRAGVALIPFLNSGSAGIAELREEAHQLGIVMNEETAKAFEKFGDDQDRLSAAWKGVKTQIVSALLPAMQGLVDRANAWIRTHQPEIAKAIAGAVNIAAKAFEGLGHVMTAVIDVFNFLADHSELVEAGLTAIAIAMGVLAAEAALAVLPFLAILAAGTALVLLVEDIRKAFQGGESQVLKAWNDLSFRLKSIVKIIGATLAAPFIGIAAIVGTAVQAVRGYVEPVINWLSEKIKWIVDKVQWARDKIGAIGDAITGSGITPEQLERFQETGVITPSNTVVPPGAGAASAAGAPSTTQTVTVTAPITINPAPGMDEAAIGKAASDHLQTKLNQAYDALRGGRR